MIELRLHGALARDFGTTWNLEVRSVREAMQALCAMVPKFRAAVLKLDQGGFVFRVKTKKEDLLEHQLPLMLSDGDRVDVIPIVKGASATARVIVGVVLVIVAAVMAVTGVGSAYAPYVAQAGFALILGSVAELLAPHPKKQDFKDDIKSWTINGPLNTTDQGNPVPVIYGEVLTGGVPISAGLTTSYVIPAAGSIAPAASVGGDTDEAFRFGNTVTGQKIVLNYSVSTINFSEGFGALGYTWSISGFSGADSVVMTGQGTASIVVTLSYTIGTQGLSTDSATVTCHVTGFDTNASAQSCDGNLTPTITLDTRVPDWN